MKSYLLILLAVVFFSPKIYSQMPSSGSFKAYATDVWDKSNGEKLPSPSATSSYFSWTYSPTGGYITLTGFVEPLDYRPNAFQISLVQSGFDEYGKERYVFQVGPIAFTFYVKNGRVISIMFENRLYWLLFS